MKRIPGGARRRHPARASRAQRLAARWAIASLLLATFARAAPLAAQTPEPPPATPDATVTPAPPATTFAPSTTVAPAASDDAGADPSSEDITPVGDPWGTSAGGPSLQGISLRALFQLRYASTFAAASKSPRPSYAVAEDYLAQQDDGWGLNRLFLRISASPDPLLRFRTILDFAELLHDNADSTIKQAYVTLRPLPDRLEFNAGLFKLPYSTLELDPIAKFEFADVGPSDDLVKDLGFAGRDLGVLATFAPLHKAKRLLISAGAFRGHAHDEHDFPAGAFGARIESQPDKNLRFGLDAVVHPRSITYDEPLSTSDKDVILNPPDPLYPRQKRWASGAAYSADAKFRRWGLSVRVEAMYGQRVDINNRYGAKSFDAVWALASYRVHAGRWTLIPALRAEWLDADLQHTVGLRRVLSAALGAAVGEHARLTLDLSRVDVQAGSPLLKQPRPLQDPAYLELDRTQITVQLQAEI